MSTISQADVTRLLAHLCGGDTTAWDQLLPLVYDELNHLAHRQRLRYHAGETLDTTALVHEAYLKLTGKHEIVWNDRQHFFRIAARAMRDIIVDYARKQQTAKRGGQGVKLPLDQAGPLLAVRVDEALSVDEALHRLAAIDERQAHIVELRYFAGLTLAETAEVLDVSISTVQRAWLSARAWLYREIASEITPGIAAMKASKSHQG